MCFKKKPKIKNPEIAQIEGNFNHVYQANHIFSGNSGGASLPIEEFMKFAKDHKVEDLLAQNENGCNLIWYVYYYNGMMFTIEVKNFIEAQA